MTNDIANDSATRSWRDIPQPVKPRAMSSGGRRRRMTAGMRSALAIMFVAAVGWGAWVLTAALRENPGHMPAVAKAVPIRAPELTTNGVLDADALGRRLALPRPASLMELDLEQLQARLLSDGQIVAATLTRNFPDRLLVSLTERSPVARIMAEWRGVQQPLLVARDGVIFAGEGFDPAMIASLPWLDGITLARKDGAFLPLKGMEIVSDLLVRARESIPETGIADPRRVWNVISLARLAADHELEVRTAAGTTVVFSAHGDFLNQIAKLESLWDLLVSAPAVPPRIDLTLGREIPIMIHPPANAAQPAFQSKTRREL